MTMFVETIQLLRLQPSWHSTRTTVPGTRTVLRSYTCIVVLAPGTSTVLHNDETRSLRQDVLRSTSRLTLFVVFIRGLLLLWSVVLQYGFRAVWFPQWWQNDALTTNELRLYRQHLYCSTSTCTQFVTTQTVYLQCSSIRTYKRGRKSYT